MDWGAWSREAVTMMSSRSRDLLARAGVPAGATYRWDLDTGRIAIGDATFRIVTVGTVSGDSCLWSWANDSIPDVAKAGIERVRTFGVDNDLALLVEECAPGGLPQLKECAALAGRILDAQGAWIDRTDDRYIAFLLYEVD